MDENKKDTIHIILILLAIFLFSFCVVYFIGAAISSMAVFDMAATAEIVSISVQIIAEETNTTIPASGNVNFTDTNINARITNLTGLAAFSGSNVNITLSGASYPQAWTEPQPTAAQIASVIEYMQIAVNASTAGSSYNVYFNISQAELGATSPNDIRLYIYETATGWTELTTTVIDSISDPAQFYAVTTHFSKFAIGVKPAAAPPAAPPVSPGGGGRQKAAEIVLQKPAPAKAAEMILKPVHRPGSLFDLTLTIPSKYRELKQGEELIAELSIINIKKIGAVSVDVEYYIEDMDGNVLFQEYATKVIENEITYIKKTEILALAPDQYMFFAKLTYNNGQDTALAGYPFEVLGPDLEKPSAIKEAISTYGIYWLGNLVILILLLIVLRHIVRKGGKEIVKRRKRNQKKKR